MSAADRQSVRALETGACRRVDRRLVRGGRTIAELQQAAMFTGSAAVLPAVTAQFSRHLAAPARQHLRDDRAEIEASGEARGTRTSDLEVGSGRRTQHVRLRRMFADSGGVAERQLQGDLLDAWKLLPYAGRAQVGASAGVALLFVSVKLPLNHDHSPLPLSYLVTRNRLAKTPTSRARSTVSATRTTTSRIRRRANKATGLLARAWHSVYVVALHRARACFDGQPSSTRARSLEER
jgi:hypothetical protein